MVSVVIASYNAGHTLTAALESVLAQSHTNLEVIVVDDGSTDDTSALLARQFPHVSYIRKTNGGLPTARNCGCLAAKGEFVALMDADDICHPDRISVQLAFMLARPDMLLCSSEFSAFKADGPIGEAYAEDYYSQIAENPGGIKALFEEHAILDLRTAGIALHSADNQLPVYVGSCYKSLAQGNFIHPPTVLFRREVLEQCGRFDESIRNMCDWDWLVRVARCGKFGYVDYPLLNYRLSESQLSGTGNSLQASLDILSIRENIARNAPELRARCGDVLQLAIGMSALAAADIWIDADKATSLQLLAKALRNSAFGVTWCKVLAKLLLPRMVLSRLRVVRRRN
ncbi:MAG: glycosyltransferase [Sterolibacteriaceae bacterium]|nr:glycosyltransferase [Candidatus Methylophosphatis haderslevensis]